MWNDNNQNCFQIVNFLTSGEWMWRPPPIIRFRRKSITAVTFFPSEYSVNLSAYDPHNPLSKYVNLHTSHSKIYESSIKLCSLIINFSISADRIFKIIQWWIDEWTKSKFQTKSIRHVIKTKSWIQYTYS